MLFLCLFLPAVRSCDTSTYPIEIPPVYPAYLFGLFLALLAWRRWPTRRALRILLTVFVAVMGAALGMAAHHAGVMLTKGLARGVTVHSCWVLLAGWVLSTLGWIRVVTWRGGARLTLPSYRLLQLVGASYTLTFFLSLLVEMRPRYGLYLSCSAALALLILAVLPGRS